MDRFKKFQVLDGTMLKIIAMISMVFDHVGDVFFPNALWMRMVGRLAMPIFAFCIAEGYIHTRDKRKYLIRMGIFALVSELPFDLAFSHKVFELGHQNIMLTFFIAILALAIHDKILGGKDPGREKVGAGRFMLGFLAVIVMGGIAIFLRADYTFFGVGAVYLFYLLRSKTHWFRCFVGVVYRSILRTMGYYITTGLSIIPLLMYNGKKGRGLKWLFYVFYPGHLLLLFIIKTLITG